MGNLEYIMKIKASQNTPCMEIKNIEN